MNVPPLVGAPGALSALDLQLGGAGLMLGRNRQDTPVVVRLFRPEPTMASLIGGLRCAQLLTFRALGLGARVLIQTARPDAWEQFVVHAGAAADALVFAPPGSRPARPGSAAAPQLIVLDVGPALGEQAEPGSGWRTTLVVRDELTAWDVDALVRADLVLMQPLSDVEAALAAPALGLTEVQEWLARIRNEMVTVVGQGTVRWALLHPTSVERQLIGPVARF